MSLQDDLRAYLLEQGASDVGFGCLPDGDSEGGFAESGCRYFLSLAIKLSDAILDEITDAPTHTYFNHYRSVNALIDQLLLKAGLFLDRSGFRYLTVAASQSINKDGWNYDGRFSHKKAACLAGLGVVGKSSLFLHRQYGARVRLGTVFTDCAFAPEPDRSAQGADSLHTGKSFCDGCSLCVRACPSGAILGGEWSPGVKRAHIFSPERCSSHMKQHFQHIGRGAVCGICTKVCPCAASKQNTSSPAQT